MTEHAQLYEVRIPVTPEMGCNAGIDMTTYAEEKARAMMLAEIGPELTQRAKLWWEIEPTRPRAHPNAPRRRWQTWQCGEMFPQHVKLLYCVMQVVEWYERNPLIYGFPDHRHDWPDFRCDDCDRKHPPPTHYCPVCGEVFRHGDDVACGHTLEDSGPPIAKVLRIPEVAR